LIIHHNLSFLLMGNGVDAARMPRVAFCNPLGRHPTPPQTSVAGDGLFGIHRARGIKPTLIADPGAQHQPVDADQNQKQKFHGF
jgi:hypothetical protein